MCEFVSWKTTRVGKVYFLTHHQLFETKRGREFLATGGSRDDYCGHGTIAWYYRHVDFTGGQDHECTDFSSPANFPPKISRAIKRGDYRGMGIERELLTLAAWKLYGETRAAAVKLYDETRAAAWKLYGETRQTMSWKLCEETRQAIFWNLFANPANRPEAWR